MMSDGSRTRTERQVRCGVVSTAASDNDIARRHGPREVIAVLMSRLSSSITFYKTMLGIRNVTPISETTVQLEYDIPSSNPITLLLEYDPLSRRLVDASVGLSAFCHTCRWVMPMYWDDTDSSYLALTLISMKRSDGRSPRMMFRV